MRWSLQSVGNAGAHDSDGRECRQSIVGDPLLVEQMTFLAERACAVARQERKSGSASRANKHAAVEEHWTTNPLSLGKKVG